MQTRALRVNNAFFVPSRLGPEKSLWRADKMTKLGPDMRTYYKVFQSPSGKTIADTDLWGNYDVKALLLNRVSKDNAITIYNFLYGEAAGVFNYNVVDAADNILYRISPDVMAQTYAFGGIRDYWNHPKN